MAIVTLLIILPYFLNAAATSLYSVSIHDPRRVVLPYRDAVAVGLSKIFDTGVPALMMSVQLDLDSCKPCFIVQPWALSGSILSSCDLGYIHVREEIVIRCMPPLVSYALVANQQQALN